MLLKLLTITRKLFCNNKRIRNQTVGNHKIMAQVDSISGKITIVPKEARLATKMDDKLNFIFSPKQKKKDVTVNFFKAVFIRF